MEIVAGVSMASSSNSTAGPASTSSGTDVTGPSGRESSEYKSELSDPDSQPGPSILDRLRAPTKSDLARKHCVAVNLPHNGKHCRPPMCWSDPKTVTPGMRIKSFPKECFSVSAGKLFCNACREGLSVKASVLQQHVKSAKHTEGKLRLECKEKHERDIGATMKAYDSEVHPKGETLPVEERVYRVKCVHTFLKAGVPLNKIESFWKRKHIG